MVSDESGDVQERIEKSKAIMHAAKITMSQSRRLISEVKQWLADCRAGEVKCESERDRTAKR